MKRPTRATNLSGRQPVASPKPKSKSGVMGKSSPTRTQKSPKTAKSISVQKPHNIIDFASSRNTRREPAAQRVPIRSAKASKKALSRIFKKSSRPTGNLSLQARRFGAYARKRRVLAISVLASFAALIALVLATIFTPLLAVEEIKVSGLKRIPEKSITKALSVLQGRPLPLIDNALVASALEKYRLIESFAVIAQPPHRVVVRIVERTPIAVVAVDGKDYLYDPAGVRLGPADGTKVPKIEIVNEPGNSAEFRAAIDVLLALPVELLSQVYSMDARTKDDVTLQLRGNAGQKIVWGDGSNSVLKSKALAVLIKNHKKTDRVTFDVSSPTTPVAIY